jgi:hypothetical protein
MFAVYAGGRNTTITGTYRDSESDSEIGTDTSWSPPAMTIGDYFSGRRIVFGTTWAFGENVRSVTSIIVADNASFTNSKTLTIHVQYTPFRDRGACLASIQDDTFTSNGPLYFRVTYSGAGSGSIGNSVSAFVMTLTSSTSSSTDTDDQSNNSKGDLIFNAATGNYIVAVSMASHASGTQTWSGLTELAEISQDGTSVRAGFAGVEISADDAFFNIRVECTTDGDYTTVGTKFLPA